MITQQNLAMLALHQILHNKDGGKPLYRKDCS
jgi:hypothetical protein